MYCKKCGNEIKEDEKYCVHCGALNEEYVETVSGVVEENNKQAEQEVKHVKKENPIASIICGIIYPIILTIIDIVIYSTTGEVSILGLVVAIICNVGMGLSMYFGGFYLIVIPLPYISLFRFGSVKNGLKTTTKVLLGILCFVLVALSFVVLFLL